MGVSTGVSGIGVSGMGVSTGVSGIGVSVGGGTGVSVSGIGVFVSGTGVFVLVGISVLVGGGLGVVVGISVLIAITVGVDNTLVGCGWFGPTWRKLVGEETPGKKWMITWVPVGTTVPVSVGEGVSVLKSCA